MSLVETTASNGVFIREQMDGYERITGEFWTARQRQMNPLHYAVSYRASFKPELPSYFITSYLGDPSSDLVLDPFAGRGTTILQANLQGFTGYSNDISPLSERIARPKTRPVSIKDVQLVLEELDLSGGCDMSDYERFAPFYHSETYREIMLLREYLRDNRSDADCFVEMTALSRLHGHSEGFFSVYSFPQISVSSQAQARINAKRGQVPCYKPIKPRIMRKAKSLLSGLSSEEMSRLRETSERNVFTCHDSRDMKTIPNGVIALIVTSPPFLNKVDYVLDNWLEYWFLGIDCESMRSRVVQTDNLEEWSDFMRDSLAEMRRVLQIGGTAAVEVGDIRYGRGAVNLDEIVASLAQDVGLVVKEVLINSQKFTKLANCFKVENMKKGTNTNRIVVLQKRC